MNIEERIEVVVEAKVTELKKYRQEKLKEEERENPIIAAAGIYERNFDKKFGLVLETIKAAYSKRGEDADVIFPKQFYNDLNRELTRGILVVPGEEEKKTITVEPEINVESSRVDVIITQEGSSGIVIKLGEKDSIDRFNDTILELVNA